MSTVAEKLTAKDFASSAEVKWCPGCGDYSILKQVQTVFPEFDIPREKVVFVSGIGCSSRFPYYMETYGLHSIHGRAFAVASGVKAVNPELSVWVVTGDGDALSIGGNHFIHLMRRNFDLNVMLFNNQIYGLTKGQYSPTSEKGQVTKSTPYGSLEDPFNPAELAIGARATFVARTLDRDPKHMQAMIKRAQEHKGASFLEIYQNCPVFNDGTFFAYSDRETKKEHSLFLEHGKPLVFGENDDKGIRLDGLKPVVVNIRDAGGDDLWIHDEKDKTLASLLARFHDFEGMPRPFGVIYTENRSTYEAEMAAQLDRVEGQKGRLPLDKILSGEKIWEIH